jgi:hypothetical protein
MAATDARPIPRKNVAYRVTFPILDADGDLVTAATALDSEVSIDGGTFTDAASEATEIAAGSGIYFLDLTAGEMNGDTVAVIVKTSSAGAKTTVLVFYPEEIGDIRVNLEQWLGVAPLALTSQKVQTHMVTTATDAIDAASLAATAGQEIADALLDRANAIETGWTVRMSHRMVLASQTGILSGAATTTVTIRDILNLKNRIVATVDADGNRTAFTTLDGT